MKKRDICISPSLICTDLCNIEASVKALEGVGIKMLHVDVIDGIFSPDMPLGIDMIRQLRKKTDMIFDVHLMSVNNAPYVDMLLDCGIDRLCFHTEFEARPSILLRKIRARGVKAGIAISPETPICNVEGLLSLCDFALFMRIDAGYAHLEGQTVYPHVNEKIKELASLSDSLGLDLELEADGRIGFDDIAVLSSFGVSTFVGGTRSIFSKDGSLFENMQKIRKITEEL